MKMKFFKIFLAISLLFLLLWVNVNTTIANIDIIKRTAQTSVLNWWTFSNSAQNPDQPLDCKSQMSAYPDEASRKALFDDTDPDKANLRLDIKACLMELKVDKYATWFIFLWIAILVGYLIFLGIKIAVGTEGEGYGGGGMPGGMPGQWGSGWIWNKIRPPIIGIWVLTFVLVGWLNALLILMKFIADLFIK